MCSRMPLVKICRLPFNYDGSNINQKENFSLGYQMTLPKLLNTNHLRTLTVGIHSSYFLQRLLLCIPFIENLSFGIKDRDIKENDLHDKISISFHRTIALLSSVLGQLCHLSLKLQACTLISGPLVISVKSLDIYDTAWTLQNAERFCTLLSNRFSNLKTLSITICDSYDRWKWRPSHIIDGKNKSTKRILSIIYLLVDRLTQLVSLYIYFFNEAFSDTPCFPYLIRRQLYQYPLSRPYRLRCSSNIIQVWL
ncbi:unnamed protein product [Rotaria sp. Silwood1]|nr:unnamed protein product [Rotaria sp. Silwood1]CAF4996224.1 unnamed protein product [Rotaria sp. Silwood1]CAF5020827.1 unnamed protein product [Rotaria sp. Silwood1]